ncbi:MAG: MFS transporter [Candidatus Eremiobacteraeota bacterium]|nr:MFS transporter [Candidatus Eremiobacteraeota bacterium]
MAIAESRKGSRLHHSNESEVKGPALLVRALRSRNYRLFFMGQSVSQIGNWMQMVATSWLVYRLTGSPFYLGLVAFSSQIPAFIFSPLAGVLLDRWNRRRILIVTQTLMMIQAYVLAFLTLSGLITVWEIITLNVVMGLITAFDMPGRQSFVYDIVERKEDLGNAIALNSSLFNAARMLGPSIAGIIVARVGEGMCFLVNALSFTAILAALLAIRTFSAVKKGERTFLLSALKEGFSYVFGFLPIKSLLSLIFLTSLMGVPAVVLMPIFSSTILHGGPETLGFLLGASGVGALAGGFFLASRRSVLGFGRIIVVATLLYGGGIVAFALSRHLWLSLILIMITGFGMMVQFASCNTLIQTVVDEDKRGRTMSLYTTSFMGASPIGALIAGGLATIIGAPLTVLLGGSFCIAGALAFAQKLPVLRETLFPVYKRLGIMPEGIGK